MYYTCYSQQTSLVTIFEENEVQAQVRLANFDHKIANMGSLSIRDG
jgi:hypothetical protein